MNLNKIILSVLLISCLSSVFAEEAADPADENFGLTHGEVLLYAGIPYIGTAAVVGISSFAEADDDLFNIIMSSSILLLNIPHCIIDPLDGIGLSLIGLGGFGSALLLTQYPELYGDQTIAALFSNIGLKASFWSYYLGYAKARKKAKPGIYPNEIEEVTFSELFAAPWDWENIKMPSVWIPTAATSAVIAGFFYISDQWQNAVWNTGRAYIGEVEVPILLGLVSTFAVSSLTHTFTGIGEEAFFRGVGYEEMKVSLGLVPAKIIDSVLFSAIHIPQEIRADVDALSILLNFAFRSSITLGLQWAYDEGGLRASVAEHMWIDVVGSVINYLLQAGSPQNELNLQLSFSYKY